MRHDWASSCSSGRVPRSGNGSWPRAPQAGKDATALPAPAMPSPEEVKRHNLIHLPPQQGRAICQLSRSNGDLHKRIPEENREKSQIQYDFVYTKTDEHVSEWLDSKPPSNERGTILTAIDVDSGSKLAVALPTKAKDNTYGEECLADFARRLGHSAVLLLRDQEPSLFAIVDQAAAKTTLVGTVVDVRNAPRCSRASLGAVGRAQQSVQKQVRALRTDVRARRGLWLSTDPPAWPWLARRAAWLLDRFVPKATPQKGYENAYETAYRGPALQFLEACLRRRPTSDSGTMTRGRRAQKADNQWDHGLWLGKDNLSNESSWARSKVLRWPEQVNDCRGRHKSTGACSMR